MPATANKSGKKNKRGGSKSASQNGGLTASTADKHELYQFSVQNVESEIDFVDAEFLRIRGRHATSLREDFCGTANTSCEWVRRRDDNTAVGLDIDVPTLVWGEANNLSQLTEDQRARVRLLDRNVLEPGDASGTDCVLAMNFSYWLFKTREELGNYFRKVRDSLGEDGIFFLDHYGGSEAMTEMVEKRDIETPDGREFIYEWDQHEYSPVTGEMTCRIHFRFPDKTRVKNAFEYNWRLWMLPEIQELLKEAGFSKVTVYWEGDELDDDGEPNGEGNGEFEPTERGSADPAFVSYITAER